MPQAGQQKGLGGMVTTERDLKTLGFDDAYPIEYSQANTYEEVPDLSQAPLPVTLPHLAVLSTLVAFPFLFSIAF